MWTAPGVKARISRYYCHWYEDIALEKQCSSDCKNRYFRVLWNVRFFFYALAFDTFTFKYRFKYDEEK